MSGSTTQRARRLPVQRAQRKAAPTARNPWKARGEGRAGAEDPFRDASRADYVYKQMRQAIRDGHFRQGDRVREEDIARRIPGLLEFAGLTREALVHGKAEGHVPVFDAPDDVRSEGHVVFCPFAGGGGRLSSSDTRAASPSRSRFSFMYEA